MAIWQFTICFIPRSWAVENNADISAFHVKGGYTTSIAWKNSTITVDKLDIFSSILPKSENDSDASTMLWGDTMRHDISAYFEDEKVDSIDLRLALNEKIKEIFPKIILAAKQLDCVFYIPESDCIIPAEEKALLAAIKNSRGLKFLKDPIAFLSELDEENRRKK